MSEHDAQTPEGTNPENSAQASSNATKETAANGPLTLAIHVADGQIGGGLGRAHWMAVARVEDGHVVQWDDFEVAWDQSHGQEAEGRHHANIVRFMRDHHIDAVVTGHMGPPMANTLNKLGVLGLVGAQGPAREVAVAAAEFIHNNA